MSISADEPKQWVSFQPSALLEPCELNEIPLHNVSQNEGKSHLNSQIGENSNKLTEHFSEVPSVQNKSIKETTTQNAKSAKQKDNKKEIRLEVASSTIVVGPDAEELKNEELKNGKLLTSVYPTNHTCAWLVPPRYDCIKMPPILANKQNALPVSTYADMIRSISSDLRFFGYAVLFSRITPIWLIFSILILLAVLASSPAGGFPIMIFALVWFLMLILGLALCVLFRKYIMLSLRNLLRDVNKIAFHHKVMVGIQDRGQLSCQKVCLMFIFYDISGCKSEVERLLRIQQANYTTGQRPFSAQEIAHKAEELLCQFSQPYAKAYMKKRFLFPTRPAEGVSDFRPKHCQKSLCLCQFVEQEYFNKNSEKKIAPWYERIFAV